MSARPASRLAVLGTQAFLLGTVLLLLVALLGPRLDLSFELLGMLLWLLAIVTVGGALLGLLADALAERPEP